MPSDTSFPHSPRTSLRARLLTTNKGGNPFNVLHKCPLQITLLGPCAASPRLPHVLLESLVGVVAPTWLSDYRTTNRPSYQKRIPTHSVDSQEKSCSETKRKILYPRTALGASPRAAPAASIIRSHAVHSSAEAASSFFGREGVAGAHPTKGATNSPGKG